MERAAKIAVKSVLVEWSESGLLKDGEAFPCLRFANTALRGAASAAPDTGAYHKTSVLVTWADGDTYQARIDLTRKHAETQNLIGEHIRSFCEFSSGRKKPPSMTEERHREYLKAMEKTAPAAGFADVLDRHALDEEPGPSRGDDAPRPGWASAAEMYEALAEGVPVKAPAPTFPKLALVVAAENPPLAPAPVVRKGMGGQYNDFKGSKYDSSLRIGEIAKRIRLDIKAAVKALELPDATYKVRPHTGRRSTDSLTVEISNVPGGVMNKDWVLNGDERGRSGTDYRYNESAKALIEKVKALVNAYNHDRSDIMTDYFDVKFYDGVRLMDEEKETAALRARAY